MSESMGNWRRDCRCGEVNENLVGENLTLMGWCHKQRDLGGLIFITLRDISGEVQIVVDDDSPAEAREKAATVRGEYVLGCRGVLRWRQDENKDMKTGAFELHVSELRVFSKAKTPPFYIEENIDVKESLRLENRFLDLRRPDMQRKLAARHRISKIVRDFFDSEGFLDIETPTLIKSTPEGARDYLVPSRVYPGKFFALPQSPQIFKQLLMLGGYDKYMQIARCYRDEDLRADRQPEFTQIDIEMSFVGEDDVLEINERFLAYLMKEYSDYELELPLQRLSWHEAMERYGSDKPDLRFDMEIQDASDLAVETEFRVFTSALKDGGMVGYIAVPGGNDMSRRELDDLNSYLQSNSAAKGLAWASLSGCEIKGSIRKFIDEDFIRTCLQRADVDDTAQLFFVSDSDRYTCLEILGTLRNEVARRRNLIDTETYRFCWITEFPLFEWDQEEERYVSKHHPFTAPLDADIGLLETDPAAVRSRSYDIVLNGTELGGGSIRIHEQELQKRIFSLLGFSEEEYQHRFGFLLNAFQYGVPPHGGLAYGLDRLVMLLVGADNIREVIAFPKVQNSSCLMTKAPATVSEEQLAELGIKFVES